MIPFIYRYQSYILLDCHYFDLKLFGTHISAIIYYTQKMPKKGLNKFSLRFRKKSTPV